RSSDLFSPTPHSRTTPSSLRSAQEEWARSIALVTFDSIAKSPSNSCQQKSQVIQIDCNVLRRKHARRQHSIIQTFSPFTTSAHMRVHPTSLLNYSKAKNFANNSRTLYFRNEQRSIMHNRSHMALLQLTIKASFTAILNQR